MSFIVPSSPIDFLVSRKFPGVPKKFVPPMPWLNGADSATSRSDWRTAEFEKAQQYRSELSALPADEIARRYETERAKWDAENVARIEQEESGRVFNQPGANADLEYWSRMPHWSLDEAIALSFGKAPELVSWKAIEPHVRVSPFAARYARLRELASRALKWQHLYDPITPNLFIAWTERVGLEFPAPLKQLAFVRAENFKDWPKLYEEMKEAKDKIIADWRDHAEQQLATAKEFAQRRDDAMARVAILESEIAALRNELEKAREARKEKSLGTRERDSLLKITIGMAMAGYKYDPRSSRNPATSEIVDDLLRLGVGVDAETLRKFLREGVQLLPGDDTDNYSGSPAFLKPST
jgi:hypothetical protein